jgi:lipopolysaccharide export system protein LptA
LQVNKITLHKTYNFLRNLKTNICLLIIAFISILLSDIQSVVAQVAKPVNTNSDTKSDSTQKKVVEKKVKKSDISTTVKYNADDSIRFDAANSIVRLYGNAKIEYGEIKLTAARIEINWLENNVTAEGVSDSLGNTYGTPVFEEGTEKYQAKKIKYNFKSKKGIISGVITQQGDGFIHGDKIKKNEANEMFVNHARYTTCNHEHPHYWIDANKIKLIPGKKFVSGPFNLMIEGMRTPLVFPLGFFPVPKARASSGIIMPSYGESNASGFFLQQGGFYWAVNDYMGLRLQGDFYSNLGFRVYPVLDYLKKYSYSGNLKVEFSKLIQGFGAREVELPKFFWVTWSHVPITRKNSRFSALVDGGASGFNSNNTTNSSQFLKNTFNSSINYNKQFGTSPFSMGIALRQDQNVRTKVMNFTLPSLTVNMSQVRPFKKIGANPNKMSWLKELYVSYGLSSGTQISNLISKASTTNGFNLDKQSARDGDTLSFNDKTINTILNNANISAVHSIPIGTSIKLLKYFSLNPTFNYNEYWNTKELKYSFKNNSDSLHVDTISGLSRTYAYSLGASLRTRLFNTLYVKSKRIEAIRHVMVPVFGFSYSPDFSSNGFTKVYTNSSQTEYRNLSIYQGLGTNPSTSREVQLLSFNVSNTLEAKLKKYSDTSMTYKKLMLLDNFGFSGNYNLKADSFKLSLINLDARTVILGRLNLNATATLDPYTYSDTTSFEKAKTKYKRFDKIADFNKMNIINFNLSASTSLNPDAFKSERKLINQMTPEMIAYYKANPQMKYVDFNIPWNLSISYNVNWTKSPLTGLSQQTAQNTNFNGDFSLTDKWKVVFGSGYDILTKKIALGATSMSVVRDLHCWQMNIAWFPFAATQTFIFNINVKATSLQDLKLTKRGQGKGY